MATCVASGHCSGSTIQDGFILKGGDSLILIQ